ncbi:DNA-binding protein [candidate division WOR-1 bacterium RIFOXYA12_FULL_43_27]|uniref:DNA-binding protein n=1 Tax=candidate division WOR-1 bacterium RIFOXYC2_FULL_46_14 TaxID=1802587 RepID=A0A1F4U3X4_UNCSA|nr:MAG: DNA-binding protein [candidate division WOR-1 bacterium RIFOXYA12_FULL_43_27]OGC20095.1 MAG: DNA-binding protein [candidate division WOR-1 bacterium RIFOXYB2_FULL_46_45]OGC32169.1 MAG: DNA-binding protein [candidate division WOR-1 bacterium RIFOXYA2_FULL_46_56]OGC39569.1 MAG: DNA-binding protein [candidate division WOR-1 bacterium RIFOXYC2_FULL_46_14]
MTEEQQALLNKSQESISAAKLLFGENYYGFAAARAYYAMFYVAEALLLSKKLSFSKHSAVIAAFGEHFAKNNIIDQKFHRYMINAYEYREISDYSPDENISKETGELTIKQAEEFLDIASSFIAK